MRRVQTGAAGAPSHAAWVGYFSLWRNNSTSAPQGVRWAAPLLRFQNHPPPLPGGPASGWMEEAFVGLERRWWSKMQRGSARGLVGHLWGAGCHWFGGEASERVIIAISLVGVQPPSLV